MIICLYPQVEVPGHEASHPEEPPPSLPPRPPIEEEADEE